jgi:hypothetical protein
MLHDGWVTTGNPAIHVHGPEALRPRLTTGLPLCDGGQCARHLASEISGGAVIGEHLLE